MKTLTLTSEELKPVVAEMGESFIEAAESEDKLPTIKARLYNGGVISVGYWGPVAIDIANLKFSENAPILYSHNRYDVAAVLGQSTEITRPDNKRIDAVGNIMASSATAKSVLDLARNGFKFQASVGVQPSVVAYVEDNEEVEVNGRRLKGPFTFVKQGVLAEWSVVVLGADERSATRIAASAPEKTEEAMKDTTEKTKEEVRADAVAEEKRVSAICAACKEHDEIRAKAIAEGWTVEQAKIAVKDAIIEAQQQEIAAGKVQSERPKVFGHWGVRAQDVSSDVIEASVCLSHGRKSVEKRYSEETLDAASRLRIHSITELVQSTLALAGKRLDCTRHQTREFLEAAFSTRDVANVVSNVANKFIMDGFAGVEEEWRKVSASRDLVDFKPHTGVRLVMANLLQSLAPNGEIKHGNISDETRSIQADTKALMLGITRKDIINDDLGVLSYKTHKLGQVAARTLNTDFWAALEAAVEENFPDDGSAGNYMTGALTETTLETADKLFAALTDSDGNPVGAKATLILTGAAAKAQAKRLYQSEEMTSSASRKASANIYYDQYKPVFSTYLSAYPWWIVADPAVIPLMEVGFLHGREEPFVESAAADFNTLGVQMRCFYDYGVAFAENKAAVYSTGE
jgi:hypothetical protein